MGDSTAQLHVSSPARSPLRISVRGWVGAFRRAAGQVASENISLLAAGCAFYGTLALFPAIGMLVSIYGLVFDRASVSPQLSRIAGLVPQAVFAVIYDRVQLLVSQPVKTLSLGLMVSTCVALWSASSGAKSMLAALNVAYRTEETRGFVRLQLGALATTLASILAMVIMLSLLLLLPAVFDFVGLSAEAKVLLQVSGFVLVLCILLGGLALLYRYGPARGASAWVWVWPGAAVATVLGLLASVLFSVYVARFARYSATYGSIGAAVTVMMWFYVTIFVVLLGAELNAELELLAGQRRA